MDARVEEKVSRLYNELFAPYPEFCKGVSWLGEETLASDAPDRFQQMWKIYLALMTKVGAEMFGSDVYWNTDSDQIEPVLDMLLNQGYSDKIIQLILGANNLLIQVKSDGYSYKTSKLREIVNQYYGIVRRYKDGGTGRGRRIRLPSPAEPVCTRMGDAGRGLWREDRKSPPRPCAGAV